MIALSLLAASLAGAAPAPALAPAPCAARVGSSRKDPASVDDLESCQRRALDGAAIAYAQANGGKLPAEALVARWQRVQDAEKAGFLARHPEGKGGSSEALAARAAKNPAKLLKIYVAPWCPHCREATTRIKELRAYLEGKGVGVRVVVGKDVTQNCQEYARNFGDDTEIDPDGVDMPSAGVPYFLVTSRDGAVLKEQAGVDPNGSGESLAAELGLP